MAHGRSSTTLTRWIRCRVLQQGLILRNTRCPLPRPRRNLDANEARPDPVGDPPKSLRKPRFRPIGRAGSATAAQPDHDSVSHRPVSHPCYRTLIEFGTGGRRSGPGPAPFLAARSGRAGRAMPAAPRLEARRRPALGLELDRACGGGYDLGLPSFRKHPQGTVRCVRLRRVRTRLSGSGM